jgi:hypothetical protein
MRDAEKELLACRYDELPESKTHNPDLLVGCDVSSGNRRAIDRIEDMVVDLERLRLAQIDAAVLDFLRRNGFGIDDIASRGRKLVRGDVEEYQFLLDRLLPPNERWETIIISKRGL